MKDRVLYSAKVTDLDPRELYINPDCGLRTRKPEVAQRMLDLVVAGAEKARGELCRHLMPKTTTIGSYPTFPRPEDVEYYLTISSHGLGDEVIDPYLWSIDEALEDFTSAGIEVPSTGQSRGDLYSLFLDPKFVKGIRWNGAGGVRRREDLEGRLEQAGRRPPRPERPSVPLRDQGADNRRVHARAVRQDKHRLLHGTRGSSPATSTGRS